MSKQVRTLTQKQLAEMITNITKQVLNEEFDSLNPPTGFDPEVGEDRYEMEQEYFKDHDDYFADDEPLQEEDLSVGNTDATTPAPDMNSLMESKEDEQEMIEKQNNLFQFITENWNHHANNLIK